jgi:branched-chain amino acid aminotransferase
MKAGFDEAILLNEQGFLADGSGENVFVVRDGVISTPPNTASCLPGITRDTVIRIARAQGYEVAERDVVRTDLYHADELFFTGTAAEITPIRSVDDHEVGAGPITKEIQREFFAITKGTSPLSDEYLDYPTTAATPSA